MSLKRNILANYASQIYVAVIGIVMLPQYVEYMGAEAYGLVGFFAMLQAWFQLLDMGLTPTMARETARFNGGASNALSLNRLLRALECIFIGIAVVGCAVMMSGSGVITRSWLKVQQLPLVDVQHAIMLMAVIIAVRWVCGLYRGVINGFERLVWLSGFNIAIATARFVLVIPLFIYIGTSPTKYFIYQFFVAIVELVVLVVQTYRLMPKVKSKQREPIQWAPLRGALKFSLSIAFTSSVWVLVTQSDKLVLSKLLPLTDFAYFTLAVMLASGVLIVSGPISGAILPRLTKLSAEGDEDGVIHLYRSATQLVGVVAIPVALVLACFAKQVLWAWTGNVEITQAAAPVLTLYALGNGILAFGAFPYYLQYAKGDLRLHLIGNAIFIVVLIPGLIGATIKHGVNGAGWAWLSANMVYFLVWVPIVHRSFMKRLHVEWLIHDVGIPTCLSIIGVLLVQYFVSWPEQRILVMIQIGVIGLSLLAISAVGSGSIRAKLTSKLRLQFIG